MSDLNFKDFLASGVFLQTGPNQFKLLTGPFIPSNLAQIKGDEGSTLLYSSNFWDFLKSQPSSTSNFIYSGTQEQTLSREDFIGLLNRFEAVCADIKWNDIDESEFEKQYVWSQKNFKEQTLKKTVPIICQKAQYKITFENKICMLKNLLKNQNYGWSYGFFNAERGMLGHTPEILATWSSQEQNLSTVAVAGTYENQPKAHVQILQDAKILDEHQIVVLDIQEKLQGMMVEKKSTRVLELKYLLHLITEFMVKASNTEAVLNVIEQLHPTAAMGIYPNNLPKLNEFSQLSLQKQRGLFASPLAFISKNSVHAIVCIRNLIFDSELVSIYSGCGITDQSDYKSELLELNNKRNSVKKMLGLQHD